MRRLVALIMAVGMLVSASSAFAQDEVRSRFYDFDNMLIDGEFKAPDLLKDRAREKAEFQRLLDLKKSFLPKIQESTEENALQ
ncbi:MAG: hypothetical protein H0U74_03070 [Bradymonadaceae bacterium]|nr:hypothetical protein [Lujinxingiaceae bacterium]